MCMAGCELGKLESQAGAMAKMDQSTKGRLWVWGGREGDETRSSRCEEVKVCLWVGGRGSTLESGQEKQLPAAPEKTRPEATLGKLSSKCWVRITECCPCLHTCLPAPSFAGLPWASPSLLHSCPSSSARLFLVCLDLRLSGTSHKLNGMGSGCSSGVFTKYE